MTALLAQRDGAPTQLGRLFVEASIEAGHAVTRLLPNSGPRAIFGALGPMLRQKPTAALLEVGPSPALIPSALKAARVPYSLAFDERSFSRLDEGGMPVNVELWRQSLRIAARSAQAVLASDPAVAARAADAFGLDDVLCFSEAIDLSFWPQATRDDARRALGLPTAGRLLGLFADLGPPLRLDLLASVHRRLPGVGLLVAGAGPFAPMIAAMAAATRPSSPVIHLGDRGPEHDLAVALAADVLVGLDPIAIPPTAYPALALGRRQVLLAAPGVDSLGAYYPSAVSIFSAQADPDGLKAAIASAFDEEAKCGPLPDDAIARARRALDASTLRGRLWKLVCASS